MGTIEKKLYPIAVKHCKLINVYTINHHLFGNHLWRVEWGLMFYFDHRQMYLVILCRDLHQKGHNKNHVQMHLKDL